MHRRIVEEWIQDGLPPVGEDLSYNPLAKLESTR